MIEEKHDPPCCPVEEVSEEEATEKTIEERQDACVSALIEVLDPVSSKIKEKAKNYASKLGRDLGLYIARLLSDLIDIYEKQKRDVCKSKVPPSPEDAKKKMLITLAERYKKGAEYKPPLKTRLRCLFSREERERWEAVRNLYREMAEELYKMAGEPFS